MKPTDLCSEMCCWYDGGKVIQRPSGRYKKNSVYFVTMISKKEGWFVLLQGQGEFVGKDVNDSLEKVCTRGTKKLLRKMHF